jgi:starch synthase
MPSAFEPCGLNQMYSLRYGTVPIVRAVGGLDDTVIDADRAEKQNGFKFPQHDPDALLRTLDRAIATRRDAKRWTQIRRNGMTADFSWAKSAMEYVRLYQLTKAKRA